MYTSNRISTRSTSTNNINNNTKVPTRRALGDVTNSSRNLGEGDAKRGVVKKAVNVFTAGNKNATATTSRNKQVVGKIPTKVLPIQKPNRSNNATSTLSRNGSFTSSNTSNYQHTGQVDNIDERDSNDPLCVTDYVQDLYTHFRDQELKTSVKPIYMEDQTHINERMRSILVDWLVEVHLKFKLVPETLYLTVNLIDRYLERKEVTRPKLQLVGVTTLLIAAKYEEIYPPELRDLVYICDRAYSKDEILEMEEIILRALEYRITIPSAHAFLVRYLKAAHADKQIVQMSCYILDGTLQSYNLLHYMPSQLAAAAVFLARRSVGRNSWSPTLLRYASFCEEEVIPVARAIIAEKSSAATELRAVNKKYSSNRYGQVANNLIQSDF